MVAASDCRHTLRDCLARTSMRPVCLHHTSTNVTSIAAAVAVIILAIFGTNPTLTDLLGNNHVIGGG